MSNTQHEPFRNLALAIARIRATNATGRLALRNTVRIGMLHLYFERGQLVHIEGSRPTADDAIVDLAGWTAGQIRFDNDVRSERHTITAGQQNFFERTLLLLQQQGVIETPPPPLNSRFPTQPSSASAPPGRPVLPPHNSPAPSPAGRASSSQPPESFTFSGRASLASGEPGRFVEASSFMAGQQYPGSLPSSPSSPPALAGKAEVLLTKRQWELLLTVVRAMLEQVGQLFGQRQVQNILQHVLTEQSKQSGALRLLQVDRQSWLREIRMGEMLTQPVQEVAEGLVLLISDFERRCASLLGEEKARQMIAQALSPYQDALAEIGIAINS